MDTEIKEGERGVRYSPSAFDGRVEICMGAEVITVGVGGFIVDSTYSSSKQNVFEELAKRIYEGIAADL